MSCVRGSGSKFTLLCVCVYVLGSLGFPGQKGEKGHPGPTGPKGLTVSFEYIIKQEQKQNLEEIHLHFVFHFWIYKKLMFLLICVVFYSLSLSDSHASLCS